MISTILACFVVLLVLLSPAILLGLIFSTVSAILSAVGVAADLFIAGIFWYAIHLIVTGEIKTKIL